MMCLETQIKELAAKGLSRKQAGIALGLSASKMKLVSDCIPGLIWQRAKGSGTPKNKGIGHDSVIGGHIRKKRPCSGTASRQERYKLDDVEGTLLQLMVHFKVMWTTKTVRKRLASGKSLREAFAGDRPKVRDWSSCAL